MMPVQPQFFLSSDDILADRRFAFGNDLRQRGDLAAAADLYAQALEIAPNFVAAWFALGDVREKLGDRAGAVEAFRQARALDPEDRHGATVRLVRLGAETADMPAGHMRALFDQYAPNFDHSLVNELGYRAPALLLAAVEQVCRAQGRDMAFGAMLDLGCGTGLAGAAFRPFVERLAGVDISPGMVAQARAKGIYDQLLVADLSGFLADAPADAQLDLVVAADVFVYMADLAPIFSAVAGLLASAGLFAFTVEAHAGEGVTLGEKLRYAHGAALVRETLRAAGLDPLALSPSSTRLDAGAPVPGLVVVARKP